MNKNELVAGVARSSGLSKAAAAALVDATFGAIASALAQGGEVRLTGFGSFRVVNRTAFQGRNPRTGAPLHIPASRQPKFKAGKALKAAVNS